MRKAMILLFAAWLADCTMLPRTADELHQGSGDSIGLSEKKTNAINREFALVVRDVSRKATEC